MANNSKQLGESKFTDMLPTFAAQMWHSVGVRQMNKILVVEDELDLIKLLKYGLEKEGFKVAYATDGSLALAEVRRELPDMIILDIMLPGLDGLEVCRQLRRNDTFARIPILIISAKSDEADRVVGLEIGADDYVTKPFSMREVVARVRALLRRNNPMEVFQKSKVHRGIIIIDPVAHAVTVAGRSVELSALEFRLLHHLALHPGMVFSRDQLLDRVWGRDRSVTQRSVDVYIRRIREKIEVSPQDPSYVQTVHGVGYRFTMNAED